MNLPPPKDLDTCTIQLVEALRSHGAMRKISDANATLLNLVLEVPDFGNNTVPPV